MIDSILQLIQRDVTRGVAGTILLKIGSGGLAFAMFSLAARAMSPDGFGVFATWLSVAQIVAVVGLIGQELLLVRFLNEYQTRGQADLTKGVLFSSLKKSSLAMLVAITAVAAVASMRGEGWLLILSVSAFTAVNAGLMLGSQVARSLVSILMGEGNREFFWRIAVVAFLVAVLSAGGRLDPAEMFAAGGFDRAGPAGSARRAGTVRNFPLEVQRPLFLGCLRSRSRQPVSRRHSGVLAAGSGHRRNLFCRLTTRQCFRHAVGRALHLCRSPPALAVFQQKSS
jgi:hypothetical protein